MKEEENGRVTELVSFIHVGEGGKALPIIKRQNNSQNLHDDGVRGRHVGQEGVREMRVRVGTRWQRTVSRLDRGIKIEYDMPTLRVDAQRKRLASLVQSKQGRKRDYSACLYPPWCS